MIQKELWGKTPDNADVWLYTITNASGASMSVCNFGARIVSLKVPDQNGVLGDVIVGPKDLEGFLSRGGSRGATIGRYSNRIAGASFELDGVTYELTKNEHGLNTLHGGQGVTAPDLGQRRGRPASGHDLLAARRSRWLPRQYDHRRPLCLHRG